MLTALALVLVSCGAVQAVSLRYAPKPDVVTIFALAASGVASPSREIRPESPMRWRIAERATTDGLNSESPNFRVNRYVVSVRAPVREGSMPMSAEGERDPVLAALSALGKTYRLRIAPDGRMLPRETKGSANPLRDIPNFDITLPNEPVGPGSSWGATVGTTYPVSARPVLRELRPLPDGDTAVILEFLRVERHRGDLVVAPGSRAVLSARDGRYFLAHLDLRASGEGAPAGTLGTLDVERLNAPGLAKLKADLRFPSE